MNRCFTLLLIILIFSPLYSNGEDYLEDLRTEPEHGELNKEGKIDILFDLPQHNLVETAYISVIVNNETIRISNTAINSSDLVTMNNKITLTGQQLYDILESKRTATEYSFTSEHYAASDDDTESDDSDSALLPDETETTDSDTDIEYPDKDTVTIPDNDIQTDEDTETDDSDTFIEEDFSWADKTYEIKLTLEMDTSGNSTEDNETDDSDSSSTTTATIPQTVEQSISVTFDNKAPGVPESAETEGGDKRIVFRVSPPVLADDSHENVSEYHVSLTGLFESNGSEIEKTIKYTDTVSSDSYDQTWEFTIRGKDGYELINNDTNNPKYIYKAVISCKDLAGNIDPENSLSTEAFAVTTYGFWSNYEKNGGKDDGGFCFIATAGFGSYFHPNVEILRNFRDSVLSKFSLGKHFIKFYYKNGKAPAELIRHKPFLKKLSRSILMPLVIFAWFLTSRIGNIILILWFGTLLLFLFRKNRKASVLSMFAILFLCTPDLHAIDGEVNFNSSFYYPGKIDKDLPGSPFKEIGGDSLRYLPMLNGGLRVPLLEKYLRWTFTVGAGYTRLSGTAIKADGEKSADKSYMHLIPLTGEMKLRPEYSFPVYPYASIGLDYYIWWIREHGETAEEGGTFGFHGNFGILLSLNWLDSKSSRKLEKSSGISNTGLFVHYHIEKIDDFGKEKSMDLSCNRFEFGIIFEF